MYINPLFLGICVGVLGTIVAEFVVIGILIACANKGSK